MSSMSRVYGAITSYSQLFSPLVIADILQYDARLHERIDRGPVSGKRLTKFVSYSSQH